MQSFSDPLQRRRSRVLVMELWGLGDIALAIPFLQTAAMHTQVTLLAKPHAAPLLKQFCPTVGHVALEAPWTVFKGKYRFHRWPWRTILRTVRQLRQADFEIAFSGRPDPRDHVLLRATGAAQRLGFPRTGSQIFLTQTVSPPPLPHRAEHWRALGKALGWTWPTLPPQRTSFSKKIVIHTGAARAVRRWPAERYAEVAARVRNVGYEIELIDDDVNEVDLLIGKLAPAAGFIGNDSGPGHIAALLGVPTFTVFGPQLPEFFSPQHPGASWIEGMPCPYKPCFDACRFPEPFCILDLTVEMVWGKIKPWIGELGI